jgi:hypothetical protein
MTDQNTLGLPAAAALNPADELDIVQDVATTPEDRHTPLSDLLAWIIAQFTVATATVKGKASFVAADFTVTAGAVSIKSPISAQILISVAGMAPQATNGCAPLATTSMGTNKQDIKTLDFDKDAVEYAQSVLFRMPSDYNGGTFTFTATWKHAATTTNFKVAWAVDAIAYADDLALDTAFGTAVQVNDIGGTTTDYYTTPVSAAVTPGGSAAAGCGMLVRVRRVATDATNDTMAIDAGLIDIQLTYTRN